MHWPASPTPPPRLPASTSSSRTSGRLLAEKCYSCHGDKKQKGGLRLDSLEAILKGGESGPAVVAGKPDGEPDRRGDQLRRARDASQRQARSGEGRRAHPLGLPGCSLARRRPRGTCLACRDHAAAIEAHRSDRAIWSLQPVRRPVVPEPVGHAHPNDWAGWSRNPIDGFILQALRKHGLTPAAEADKPTLIRRATFDLTGLPPTPEEVDAFLADDTTEAYERLIDRLLASPRYGQRWGRHWLDLVRYAESDGYRQDAFRPHAWRYRDYVVRAFNTDKPYDRFLTEQLAGDELDPDDPELRVATGYLRLGTYEYNQRNVRGQWADILNDITDVTGEVFLGLEHRLCPLPRPQVRPDPAKGLLPAPGVFHSALAPRRLDAGPTDDNGPTIRPNTRRGRKRRPTSCGRSTSSNGPTRDKGTASATAKFPDEIKAILKQARSRSVAARAAARCSGVSADRLRARTGAGIAQGAAKARWDELHKLAQASRRLAA